MDTARYQMSLLIVPLLYPDFAELPNFSDPIITSDLAIRERPLPGEVFLLMKWSRLSRPAGFEVQSGKGEERPHQNISDILRYLTVLLDNEALRASIAGREPVSEV